MSGALVHLQADIVIEARLAPGTDVAWSPFVQTPRAERGLGCPETPELRSVALTLATIHDQARSATAAQLRDALQRAGSADVWPRSLVVEGPTLASVEERARVWTAHMQSTSTRCATVTVRQSDGTYVASAMVAESRGRLRALPRTFGRGEYATVSFTAQRPDDTIAVIVLGPDGSVVRPTLHPDQEEHALSTRLLMAHAGRYTIQVTVDEGAGPKPAANAVLFVATPPDATQQAGALAPENLESAFASINATRARLARAPLTRDAALDALAEEHLGAVVLKDEVTHDAGHGTLAMRAANAKRHARVLGENVARARSLSEAQESLLSSPSHAENIVAPYYQRVGLATTRTPDGDVWIVQVFASAR